MILLPLTVIFVWQPINQITNKEDQCQTMLLRVSEGLGHCDLIRQSTSRLGEVEEEPDRAKVADIDYIDTQPFMTK